MISVIMPVYNEAKALPVALRALERQSVDHEIIVVDGGSDDGTCELAAGFAGVRIVRADKGRAKQMNAGAQVARGDVLLFLHADTLLPDGALAQLESATVDARCNAGAFRHCFSHPHPLLRVISAVNNLRCRCTRIFYGDQAMFVRAAMFRDLGGFPDVALLEDILLCERLREVTRPVLLPQAVVTDARRFLELGIVRTSLRALVILLRHRLRLPVGGRGFREEIR